ncbi:hypothetical protein [Streptomyces sp. NRRL F-5123]|uniref:hypothetical protein n=1 Tax=Streptomyces sp. NRRL F-5123 TaxID=1463856 RepID=UPI00099BB0A0|nr:hypothetical protein [Streptomyces sp. NRRL F-5123]
MRQHVRRSRSDRTAPAFEEGHERGLTTAAGLPDADASDDLMDIFAAESEAGAEDVLDEDTAYVVRLSCPGCGRPISVLADEDRLPQHALCPTPWNPFGLTVCDGSGRAVAEAGPVAGDGTGDSRPDLAVLLTLPAGLDWRTQPFSHVGGPETRPVHLPAQGLAA